MPRRARNQALADEVGRRLRVARVTQGLSQEKLAERAGVHTTYIGHVEHGRVAPTIDSIVRLAGALDVTLSELFDGIEATLA